MINWSELRAAAISIGVREAARQAAADLPQIEQERFVQRVMKRCQREKWLGHKHSLSIQTTNTKPLSAVVRTGSQAILSHLEQAKRITKSNLAKFTVNASKVAARSRSPLKDSQDVKNVASVMSTLWPEENKEQGINLNVLSIGGEMAIQVNKGSTSQPQSE